MILITGGTGFVGRSLTNALAQADRPFRVYTDRINKPLVLRQALADVTTVIHLASAESSGSPRRLQHVDVEGAERLVEECARAGVERLIFLSRLNADPNSAYPLLRAKGEAERIIRESDVPAAIIRSATLFGRYDRFTNVIDQHIRRNWPFIGLPGRGEVAMQPLWVEDLVRCLLLASDRPALMDRTIRLAGEERLRYREVVEAILLATGRWRILVPSRLITARILVLTGNLFRVQPPMTRFHLDRFSVPDVAELDSVLRHFGFRPRRLASTIAYLRGRPGYWRFR